MVLSNAAPDPAEARARLAQDLAATANGDREALKRIYQATSAKLFGVCLRILQERGAAEEVLQEVYLVVWRKAEQFERGKASPITWLATIARNKAIDRLRERGGLATDPLEAAASAADPAPRADAVLEASDDYRRLSRCLETLEPRYARVIRTAFWEGVTYDRLAQREGVPAGTLKSWIRRGMLSLKTCLEP
ncbi:MAG: sigma-70 family RNA polymerase sigma factor [Pseudomonadota bacterium]|nr:sigma-70 family RNA polymerase sigma factor [Pseudomonadota bacterium]